MTNSRARLVIHGLVQGVNFRYYTRQKANALGLTGWVRNMSNGNVEVVLEGESDGVRAMITWCHQGPAWAKVTKVDVKNEPFTGEYERFDVSY